MRRVFKKRLLAVVSVTVFVFMAVSPALTVEALDVPSDLNVGPYVDRIIFRVNQDDTGRLLNLDSSFSDINGGFLHPDDLLGLVADPDISLSSHLRNGYGHITINCGKYPLNISAFRRAFAYAFNKTRVTSEILAFGILSREHDSIVPYSNSWCIEDDLPYHYYTAQVATGAEILDAAGFTIDPDTGYRLAPDGSPFDVIINMSNITQPATDVGLSVTLTAVDALTALDIDASIQIVGNFEYLMTRIDNNDDFDMVFYAYDFFDDDVDWLAYSFWGELADVPYENPCNFRNEIYDSWRNQLLHSNEYDEVYEAASEMQMILHENVPMVVVYENVFWQAFRNDEFTGQVEDLGRGVTGTWTLRNIHRIDGFPGDTVLIEIVDSPNTFNNFLNPNIYASSILDELWPSLYLKGPDLSPVPYLAENMIIETHADNPDVKPDHTRFTIDIVQNAKWTDGIPITADDVVFSLRYAVESGVHGNPAGKDLSYLVAAYTPTTYRAVIEFESESYWHFSDIAYNYIVPEHLYRGYGVDYENWYRWDIVNNSTEPYVTGGPFELTDYVPDDFYELSANPDFWLHPTTTAPESWILARSGFLVNITLVLAVGGVGAAVVVQAGLTRRR